MDFSAPETLAAAALIALAAGVIRGITGFGGAMVMTPPLALLLGPAPAVAVALLLESVAAAPMVVHARREVRWNVIGPILAAACATVPLGGYLLITADAATLRRVISLAVIAFALLLLLGRRFPGRPRLATSIGLGALSGAMAGATSIGGPPVVLYLLSGPDPAAATRANLALFVCAISLVAVAALALLGALGRQELAAGALLAPGYLAGLAAGTRLFARFSETRFRQFTLLLMITVSVGVLLR